MISPLVEGGHEGSPLVRAVPGRPPAKGEAVDLASIRGRPCRLNVTIVTSEKGIYNRITEIGGSAIEADAGRTGPTMSRRR